MQLTEYRGLSVPSSAPANLGGQAIMNDLKEMANRAGPVYQTASSPGPDNDSDDTAGIGIKFYQWSHWLDTSTNEPYICLDATTGAAIWLNLAGGGGGSVPTSRTISTTAPLTGGGDLSANRTLAISAATTSAAGSMSAADKTKLDGIGDTVAGPGSATDNAVARFDGTTGKVVQNSAVTVADTTGDITAGKFNTVAISGTSSPALAVTGTSSISGTNTGDQTSVSGNSGSTNALASATTTVNVSAATAPTAGQALIATDSTHATWRTLPSLGTYFGNGSDGAVTVSSNTNWTSSTGVNDTGIVSKNFTSLTINSGVTVTAATRSSVMIIFCTGDVTINGTLHMDYKGAAASPSNATSIDQILSTGYLTNFLIPVTGAAGGAARTSAGKNDGANGSATIGDTPSLVSLGKPIITLKAGGGGSGFGDSGGGAVGTGGAGAAASAFGGGSGGGSGGFNGGGSSGTAAAANLGAGGNAGVAAINWYVFGGGAGNPPGTTSTNGGGSAATIIGGGGGVIIIVCGGTLTVGSGGIISSAGATGGTAANSNASGLTCGGGGAGGGIILLLYKTAYINSGNVSASGGLGGLGWVGLSLDPSKNGGNGGDGAIYSAQVL